VSGLEAAQGRLETWQAYVDERLDAAASLRGDIRSLAELGTGIQF